MTELDAARERLEKAAQRWSLNGPTARVSIKLGDLRAALTAWNTRPSVVDEDAIILAMCRAHDREEAAQMGEPSPWREDFDRDPDWEQNRFLAMREAFDEARVLLSASTVEG
jgi:thioredoxin-like negative regulator of GroEL